MFNHIPTPALLLDRDRLAHNVARMQLACDRHGVELWPHIKTHKMVEVARLQLRAGAAGLTCAKVGEAEVMLASGVRRIFIDYSLVDPLLAPRLGALAAQLDELIVACTSLAHAPALEKLIAAVGMPLPVMMAVDTGLGREGARDTDSAVALAERIQESPWMSLRGIYTHEGHTSAAEREKTDSLIHEAHERLLGIRDRIDPHLPLWPGCSVTAERFAAMPGVTAIRPGTYVFGDLNLIQRHQVMCWDEAALTVLATVVDRPQPGLALLDSGSKALSSDRTSDGIHAVTLTHHHPRAVEIPWDRQSLPTPAPDHPIPVPIGMSALTGAPGLPVIRCNEEHGFLIGAGVDHLKVGQRVRLVPAHVCPVVNLADEVTVVSGSEIVDVWQVAARGKSR